jgi:hypothetical protein
MTLADTYNRRTQLICLAIASGRCDEKICFRRVDLFLGGGSKEMECPGALYERFGCVEIGI